MAFSMHVQGDDSATRHLHQDQEILALLYEGCLLLAVLFQSLFLFHSPQLSIYTYRY